MEKSFRSQSTLSPSSFSYLARFLLFSTRPSVPALFLSHSTPITVPCCRELLTACAASVSGLRTLRQRIVKDRDRKSMNVRQMTLETTEEHRLPPSPVTRHPPSIPYIVRPPPCARVLCLVFQQLNCRSVFISLVTARLNEQFAPSICSTHIFCVIIIMSQPLCK